MKRKKPEVMSFLEHLEELRRRLIIIAAIIMIATVICYLFVEDILRILTLPAQDMKLIFLSPPEAFMANIRLAFMAGILVSMPFIIYQIVVFIMPALRRSEKRVVIPLVISMVLFFALGVSFGYCVVFPFAIRFFMSFATSELVPRFSISNYISFVTTFLLAFGIVFQTPLVFWFLGRIGILTPTFLSSNRKYAVLVIAIISAVITPPDIFSQLLMIGPLMVLYELGLFLVKVSQRKAREEEVVSVDEP